MFQSTNSKTSYKSYLIQSKTKEGNEKSRLDKWRSRYKKGGPSLFLLRCAVFSSKIIYDEGGYDIFCANQQHILALPSVQNN